MELKQTLRFGGKKNTFRKFSPVESLCSCWYCGQNPMEQTSCFLVSRRESLPWAFIRLSGGVQTPDIAWNWEIDCLLQTYRERIKAFRWCSTMKTRLSFSKCFKQYQCISSTRNYLLWFLFDGQTTNLLCVWKKTNFVYFHKHVAMVKHGHGSIMLWGCSTGIGKLVRVDKMMYGRRKPSCNWQERTFIRSTCFAFSLLYCNMKSKFICMTHL